MDKNWKTIYECHKCGNIMSAGAGNFGSRFFWDSVCGNCGADKGGWETGFIDRGIAYKKWTPTWIDWFKSSWISREGKNLTILSKESQKNK